MQKILLSELEKSPLNIRGEYIEETVLDLAESIKEHGLLRPLIIRPMVEHEGRYEVLSGGRRREALMKLYGKDYELSPTDFKIFKGDDLEALTCGLIDQMHTMGFSSTELGKAASKLKELKPKISHKDIAKILWTTESRVKRVLEMVKDDEIVPSNVREELGRSDSESPTFTDAHWDKLKGTALDLSDKHAVTDVCDYIMSHEVPPSKVEEVVSQMLKKQAKEEGRAEEEPKKEKPKDPNVIGEDDYNGYLEKQPDGSWAIKSKKGLQPLDLGYYRNYADHPDFRVFVKGKITIKNIRRDD